MAHSATHFSFFLLLVVLFHSPQTQARLGNFYDELPNLSFTSPSISQPPSPFFEGETSPAPSLVFEGEMSPVAEPEGEISEAPMVSQIAPTPGFEGVISEAAMLSEIASAPVEAIDNAYGLYGSSDKVTNNVAVDVDDNERFNKKTTEKAANNVVVDDEREEDAFPSNGFNTESFKEVNNYNQNGYNNLPYNNNENNNGVSNYNEDGYVGRDGMSDTRFMENGKYSYDVQNDGNNGGRYYGDRTKYEFESMDEYEREQGYPDNQKYYVP